MKNRNKVKFVGRGVLVGIGALAFAALMALIMGWVLMLLWNWLMPEIFGLPLIGYWQAWGLILLSHLLFKGGGGHGRSPRFHPARFRGDGRGNGRGNGSGRRPHGGGHRSRGNEDFDDFRNEFRHRMRARWHDSESAEAGESGHAADEGSVPEDRD